MRSIAIRIDKRFEDAYWEPPEEPDPETIHSDLEPLIQELEELITDPPDHEDVEPTLHFAEDLRQECVRLKKDPDYLKEKQYRSKEHMVGLTSISIEAKELQHRAETELRCF